MALSDIDRNLLERCLANQPRAWEDFVDRFMGLVMHVINHTAQCRSILLSASDREDLASEVMLTLVDDDFAVLRNFRGKSSLATYLTVVARRVVVRKMLASQRPASLGAVAEQGIADDSEGVEQRMTNQEEVEEISRITGMPTNSVGPTLTRARNRLRGQSHV